MENISELPDLVIGDLTINPPIIQGGMGVLVSSSRLAAAVSNEGALGVVAAVGAGEDYVQQELNYKERSFLGLRKMLKKAKDLSSNPIAVNVMCALSNYADLVKAAEKEGVAAIISGAGLPLQLPGLVESRDIKLIPVVSSDRAASIICRTWWKKFKRFPDAIIVEGHSAGGHLGFSLNELATIPRSLENIVSDVLAVTKEVRSQHNVTIPVIAAGGVFDGNDIARFLRLGASGVQMGTRFVCTHECDAAPQYKETYINSTEEDIVIIESPVKLPLRVVRNAFVDKMQTGKKEPFKCDYQCLKNCKPATSPYCIAKALKNASEGNMDEGFVTCGSNAYRINHLSSVKELIKELVDECFQSLSTVPPPVMA